MPDAVVLSGDTLVTHGVDELIRSRRELLLGGGHSATSPAAVAGRRLSVR